jgi:hypothetical protein
MSLTKIEKAPLPVTYLKAKDALAKCQSLDECGEWADKAEALASYGRQANDETMVHMAMRIRGRAIRRVSELMKLVPSKAGVRTDLSPPGGRGSGRLTMGKAAGLSKKQLEHASKIGKMSEAEFEERIEATPPPTVKQLAAAAKHRDPFFPKATAALGTLRRFGEFCTANDPEKVAGAVMEHEIAEAKKSVGIIDSWLDVFVSNLGK